MFSMTEDWKIFGDTVNTIHMYSMVEVWKVYASTTTAFAIVCKKKIQRSFECLFCWWNIVSSVEA